MSATDDQEQFDKQPLLEQESGALSATLGVTFMERDGKLSMVFEGAMDQRLVHLGVTDLGPHPDSEAES